MYGCKKVDANQATRGHHEGRQLSREGAPMHGIGAGAEGSCGYYDRMEHRSNLFDRYVVSSSYPLEPMLG